jgi:hypothetical protein
MDAHAADIESGGFARSASPTAELSGCATRAAPVEVAAVQELLLALLSSRDNPSTPDELKHHHSSLIPPFEPPNERISFAVRLTRLLNFARRKAAEFRCAVHPDVLAHMRPLS